MGASGSRSSNGQHKPVEAVPGQFVIIITAPPGVGKEELMGTFISDNVDRIAYVARIGAVRATQPVCSFPFERPSTLPVPAYSMSLLVNTPAETRMSTLVSLQTMLTLSCACLQYCFTMRNR